MSIFYIGWYVKKNYRSYTIIVSSHWIRKKKNDKKSIPHSVTRIHNFDEINRLMRDIG